MYNQYGNLNPKVATVSNIDCSHEGYVFPEEKQRPIHKCKYKLEATDGQTIDEEAVLIQDEAGRVSIQYSSLLTGSNVGY